MFPGGACFRPAPLLAIIGGMAVSDEDVRRIASLARLELTPDEGARLASELSQILAFAESIRNVDTSGVQPTTHVIELTDVWRADVPGASLDRATVQAQSPEASDGCFLAPRIV